MPLEAQPITTEETAEPTTIEDGIAEAAKTGITSLSSDGQSTSIDSDKMIRADIHLANKSVSSNPFTAVRRARIIPPGT